MDPVIVEYFELNEINLTIAGAICEYAIREHGSVISRTCIKLLGNIHSISNFYSQIDVVLNLVGPSTGVKIKSIEALMHGKILVTTKFGVDASFYNFYQQQIILLDKIFDLNFINYILGYSSDVDSSKIKAANKEYSMHCKRMFNEIFYKPESL